MQMIKIGNSEALIFFNRGANIHVIHGSLAEREGLQKVSSNPTNLTVVGGRKVRSNHGTLRFNLGPGDLYKSDWVLHGWITKLVITGHNLTRALKLDLGHIRCLYLKFK